MKTLLICIIGLIVGYFISSKLGDNKVFKIIFIILLLLFALWNEGVFG